MYQDKQPPVVTGIGIAIREVEKIKISARVFD